MAKYQNELQIKTSTLKVYVLSKYPIQKYIDFFPVIFLFFSELWILSGDIALTMNNTNWKQDIFAKRLF